MNKSKYYKHPQFGQVYLNEVVGTPVGRLVWPYFTEPRPPGPPKEGWAPQPPKHEGTLLLEKGVPENEAWIAEMTEESKAMLELFNKNNRAPLAQGLPVVRDGDDFDAEKYPYYKNKWIITAKNQHPPKFVDAKVQPIEPNAFLGGMEVRFSLTAMVSKGGFSYKLNSVQLVRDDGARYGGGTRDFNAVFEACDGEAPPSESAENSEQVVETPAPAQTTKVAPVAPVAAPVKAATKRSGLDKAAMDRL